MASKRFLYPWYDVVEMTKDGNKYKYQYSVSFPWFLSVEARGYQKLIMVSHFILFLIIYIMI